MIAERQRRLDGFVTLAPAFPGYYNGVPVVNLIRKDQRVDRPFIAWVDARESASFHFRRVVRQVDARRDALKGMIGAKAPWRRGRAQIVGIPDRYKQT